MEFGCDYWNCLDMMNEGWAEFKLLVSKHKHTVTIMAVSSSTKKQTKVTAAQTRKSFSPVKYFCSSLLDNSTTACFSSVDGREEESESASLDIYWTNNCGVALVFLSMRRVEQSLSYLLMNDYRKQEQANDAGNFLAMPLITTSLFRHEIP